MSGPADCVFCKIVAGEIPSLGLLDDPHAYAFLDIGPLADGHLLLIPKTHVGKLDEMTPDQVVSLTRHLPRLGRALIAVTPAAGYNVLQNNGRVAGQVVQHVHFHIIPRVEGDGLGYRWPAKSYPAGRAEALAERISKALAGAWT